jgi:hypothetical protein
MAMERIDGEAARRRTDAMAIVRETNLPISFDRLALTPAG